MKKLTAKQQKFCEEYLVDLNATQAAIRAGYSKNTADAIGHENLRKPNISEYIKQKQKEIQDSTKITIDKVVKEIARLGFSDIRKLYDENGKMKQPHELDDETAAAVQEITVRVERSGSGEDVTISDIIKYKFADKGVNLDKLMKHLGGYMVHNKQKATVFENETLRKIQEEISESK